MPKKTVAWYGVRNYQARNFMRDQMQVGDLAFFYHSSCPEPGIAGIVKVSKAAYPDASQFDKKSPYYDAKATREAPRWLNVEVTLVNKTRLIALAGTARASGTRRRCARCSPAIVFRSRQSIRASGHSSRPGWSRPRSTKLQVEASFMIAFARRVRSLQGRAVII